MQTIANYINGKLFPPRSGDYLDNIEPATGKPYARVPDSSASDVEQAADAATSAFPAWSALPAAERSAHLLRIADAIEKRLEEFARAESIDTGKPISLARTVDIPRAVKNFRFFATAILHTESQMHDTDGQAVNYTLRRARGVAGLVSPWNLPLYLLSWKIAPAIATGNTAVAKPSEITPMTAALLADVCREANLPPGVLNIVHGRGATAGQAVVEHPATKMVSFTGGTVTGAQVARTAAPLFKKISLELGGKNANLIFADADLDQAIASTVRSSFANQGQICLCGSRILVKASIMDEFLSCFVTAVKALKTGDPLEEDTQQGAVVSQAQLDKVSRYVAKAREEGGKILCGGEPPALINERCRDGYFFPPTVITGLAHNSCVNQEEIFGPVVTVTPFADEAEAVTLANDTPYGLSATLWTQHLTRAHRVAAALDVGTVWINCWLLRDLRVPFGGTKQSGVGREGGDEAIRFFTEPKNVCIQL